MIWCDTRQQAGKHFNIDHWFDEHDVAYEYKKLDFGDYMRDGSNISVDTKQGMDELAGNLGHDHARFTRECDRAHDAGYRLIVLVEGNDPGFGMRDLAAWRPLPCRRCLLCDPHDKWCARYKRRPLQGRTLQKIMGTMTAHHGVLFQFCWKLDTARIICETLGEEVQLKND